MEEGPTGSAEGQPDQGQAYTEDDTEYNIFNTDRRLQAIASLAKAMQDIDQKKSVLYFSSGMDRDTGNENQSQLRAAINVAVKANVSIYPVDSRGLEAIVPGGSAQLASLHGQAAYNGNAITSAYDSNFKTQETLVTLAADTGGKAFLDSNDFSKAFAKVQADMESYYVLGYRSSNPAMDGRYRKITVKVNRPDVKLDYRRGYYGPRDFRHFTRDDRDRQMEEELNSDLPNTDLPVYLATQYFRTESGPFFRAAVGSCAGIGDPFRGQRSSLARRAWRGSRPADQISGGQHPANHQAGDRERRGRAAQERAVQHRIPASVRQVSSEVRGARKPEWQTRVRLKPTSPFRICARLR